MSLPNVRKSLKAPPTFNLIVVGAERSGKTSFVKTLLENLELSEGIKGDNGGEMMQRIREFGMMKTTTTTGGRKLNKTRKIESISVECVERGEKLGITVIDTPGLKRGDKRQVERQLEEIVKLIEDRFDETLKAVRFLLLFSFFPLVFCASLSCFSLGGFLPFPFHLVKEGEISMQRKGKDSGGCDSKLTQNKAVAATLNDATNSFLSPQENQVFRHSQNAHSSHIREYRFLFYAASKFNASRQ